jgi:hypothetical protein
MFFNKLNFDIQVLLVNNWLQFLELGRLDSAFCNKNEREVFLELISNELVLIDNNRGLDSTNILKWIESRGIHIVRLFIAEKPTETVCFPEQNLSHIVSLSFTFLSSTRSAFVNSQNGLFLLINNCICLQELCIKNYYFTENLFVNNMSVFKQLKKFEMWGNREQLNLFHIAELKNNRDLLTGEVNVYKKESQQFAVIFDSSYTNINETVTNILQSDTNIESIQIVLELHCSIDLFAISELIIKNKIITDFRCHGVNSPTNTDFIYRKFEFNLGVYVMINGGSDSCVRVDDKSLLQLWGYLDNELVNICIQNYTLLVTPGVNNVKQCVSITDFNNSLKRAEHAQILENRRELKFWMDMACKP